MFVEQDVSVGLQLVLMLSLGAGSRWWLWSGLSVPRASAPSGAASSFLVLRVKAHKPIRFSHALLGPANSGERGPEKGALVLLLSFWRGFWPFNFIFSHLKHNCFKSLSGFPKNLSPLGTIYTS